MLQILNPSALMNQSPVLVKLMTIRRVSEGPEYNLHLKFLWWVYNSLTLNRSVHMCYIIWFYYVCKIPDDQGLCCFLTESWMFPIIWALYWGRKNKQSNHLHHHHHHHHYLLRKTLLSSEDTFQNIHPQL